MGCPVLAGVGDAYRLSPAAIASCASNPGSVTASAGALPITMAATGKSLMMTVGA